MILRQGMNTEIVLFSNAREFLLIFVLVSLVIQSFSLKNKVMINSKCQPLIQESLQECGHHQKDRLFCLAFPIALVKRNPLSLGHLL